MVKNNELNITIADNIKNLRKQFGLTQKQVADYLSISQENLSQIENGKRGINVIKLLELSDLFGIKFEEFLKPMNFRNTKQYNFSFRKKDLDKDLLKAMAYINKFSEEYIKMEKLLNDKN